MIKRRYYLYVLRRKLFTSTDTQLQRSQHLHSDIESHCSGERRRYSLAEALSQLGKQLRDLLRRHGWISRELTNQCRSAPHKSDMSLDVKEALDRYEIKIFSPDLTSGNVKLSLRNNFLFLPIDRQLCKNILFYHNHSNTSNRLMKTNLSFYYTTVGKCAPSSPSPHNIRASKLKIDQAMMTKHYMRPPGVTKTL